MILAALTRITLVAVVAAAVLTLLVVAAGVACVAGLDSLARRRLHAHDAALEARSGRP